jgi:hypothetical protein
MLVRIDCSDELGHLLRCSCNYSTGVDSVWRHLSGRTLLVPLRLGNIVYIDNVHLCLNTVSCRILSSTSNVRTKVSLSPPVKPIRRPSLPNPGT